MEVEEEDEEEAEGEAEEEAVVAVGVMGRVEEGGSARASAVGRNMGKSSAGAARLVKD